MTYLEKRYPSVMTKPQIIKELQISSWQFNKLFKPEIGTRAIVISTDKVNKVLEELNEISR